MYKKHVIIITMGFITLAYGAASSSSTFSEDPADTKIVGISSLYDVRMIKIPEDLIIHIPFVVCRICFRI